MEYTITVEVNEKGEPISTKLGGTGTSKNRKPSEKMEDKVSRAIERSLTSSVFIKGLQGIFQSTTQPLSSSMVSATRNIAGTVQEAAGVGAFIKGGFKALANPYVAGVIGLTEAVKQLTDVVGELKSRPREQALTQVSALAGQLAFYGRDLPMDSARRMYGILTAKEERAALARMRIAADVGGNIKAKVGMYMSNGISNVYDSVFGAPSDWINSNHDVR